MNLVTGGAGFIGSHLVDALIAAGEPVRVLDNLSTGRREWVHPDAELVLGDAQDPLTVDAAMADVETVWHVAANPDVRTGATDPQSHYTANVEVTWQVLSAARRAGVKNFRFTSTSTVYGEATVLPTPEDYGPLYPISVYAGAKLACEGLITAMASTFGMSAHLYRFANVVGPRSNHGVTYDFVGRLRQDPTTLSMLGDGTQTKSYVHVDDTVSGMLAAHPAGGIEAYNIGSLDAIPVTRIADEVCSVLGITPEYSFAGGTPEGAGWAGDVKNMGLAIDKLQALGWQPQYGSAEAIRATASWLATHIFAS